MIKIHKALIAAATLKNTTDLVNSDRDVSLGENGCLD